MLADAKSKCDILVVGLQTDPTIDRPNEKNKPIQEFAERKIMINGIKYVDHVIEYSTEEELLEILRLLKPDVRIIGTDWKGNIL
jgi:glycerol-3-phosphate cytidylyltransferase